MAVWYCNYGNGTSTGYYGVAQWAATTAYTLGQIVRQLATPSVGQERCFRCSTAGTTGGTEPAWNTGKVSMTASDGTVSWIECSGSSTYNTTTPWQAPHARLSNAAAWGAAGDTIYVGDNHAETSSTSITCTLPGSGGGASSQVLCVNHSGSVPPVSADLMTTASITNTSGGLTLGGNSYINGISFNTSGSTGINVATASAYKMTFENCAFNMNYATSATNLTLFPTASGTTCAQVDLINTTVSFAHASGSITPKMGHLNWYNTPSALSGTATNIMMQASLSQGVITLDGVDLSFPGATGVTVNNGSNPFPTQYVFKNCRLPTNTIFNPVTTYLISTRVMLIDCDSGNTNYQNAVYDNFGTMLTNATVVRSGGASDGTTPVSWKVVTTALAQPINGPFQLLDVVVWVDTAAAHTATFELVTDNVILTNADVRVEAQYQGSGSYPTSSMATNGLADPLATAANLGTSAASWTTTGLTTPKTQNLVVSFTTAKKGAVRFKIKIMKASTTLYFDPQPAIT